jgi:hypothetical protein
MRSKTRRTVNKRSVNKRSSRRSNRRRSINKRRSVNKRRSGNRRRSVNRRKRSTRRRSVNKRSTRRRKRKNVQLGGFGHMGVGEGEEDKEFIKMGKMVKYFSSPTKPDDWEDKKYGEWQGPGWYGVKNQVLGFTDKEEVTELPQRAEKTQSEKEAEKEDKKKKDQDKLVLIVRTKKAIKKNTVEGIPNEIFNEAGKELWADLDRVPTVAEIMDRVQSRETRAAVKIQARIRGLQARKPLAQKRLVTRHPAGEPAVQLPNKEWLGMGGSPRLQPLTQDSIDEDNQAIDQILSGLDDLENMELYEKEDGD